MAKPGSLRKVYGLVTIAGALMLTSHGASADQDGLFRKVGTFMAPGKVTGSAEGPTSRGGERALYVTRTYFGKGINAMAVNPTTGVLKEYANPVRTETTAYGLILGPDANMYMGTVPNAHLYRLSTRAQKLEDLGIPIPGEKYIWDLATAENGKIYGVTYPHCGLFSYDPKTGVTENLGRMSRTNEYAHYIVSGGDGYLYIGTGATNAGIVAYNIGSGRADEIVPQNARGRGFYHVAKNKNGVVYASGPGHTYTIKNGAVKGISKPVFKEIMAANVPLARPKIKSSGHEIQIFRMVAGGDGIIYGSSILPMYIFALNLSTGHFSNLGQWGNGEAYSLQWHADRLLIGAYGAPAPLMSYVPDSHASFEGEEKRVLKVTYPAADEGWRPMAMAVAENNMAYVGAVAGTGILDGQFDIWNLKTNQVQSFQKLIPSQGIASLVVGEDGWVYGGSSVVGGVGTVPKEKSAVLFGFNPKSQRIEWKITPIPGAQSITDLFYAMNGKLFGFADNTLFEYVPSSRQVARLAKVNYGSLIYNSVISWKDGMIYGLASKGIFVVDPKSGQTHLVAKAPEVITAGGALVRGAIYFASGSDVYEYALPN